jgi:hypothetical protein
MLGWVDPAEVLKSDTRGDCAGRRRSNIWLKGVRKPAIRRLELRKLTKRPITRVLDRALRQDEVKVCGI